MANPHPAKPFKKGTSGNPNGRPPKGYSITEMMKKLLATKVKDAKGRMVDPREAIGRSILKKALEGDVAAQKMVWQYMDGMPQQNIDATSGGEKIQGITVYMPEERDE